MGHKRSSFRPGVAAKISARARIVGGHIGYPVKARFDRNGAGAPRAFLAAEVGAVRGMTVRYVLAVLQEHPGHTDDREPSYVVHAGPANEAWATTPLPLADAIRAFQAGAVKSARLWGLAKASRARL